MTERIDPQTMADWLTRRIHSAEQWLEDFGHGSKKRRPDSELEAKEFDIRALKEIKIAYERALERKLENDKG